LGSVLFAGIDDDYVESIECDVPEEMLYATSYVNLETSAQDFVLETQQIEIPGHPLAFNPSIIRWQGRLLLSFRIRYPETLINQIGLIFLDEEFHPDGSAQILDIRMPDPLSVPKRQDPRLVAIGDKLFVVYNNVLLRNFKPEIRRMFAAEVHFDGTGFYVDQAEYLRYFEDEKPDRSDKNWVPFDYEGTLLMARFLDPHWVLRPIWGTGICETFSKSARPIYWDWGQLRGGTPALLINPDEYLAFFHSSINMPSLHSKGKIVRHYFMGAYVFSAHPPFEIKRMSSEPIIGKNFYLGKEHQTWKPLHVVFPGGFVFDDRYIWIAYGRQDHEIWIVKLDKERLLNSLTSTSDGN